MRPGTQDEVWLVVEFDAAPDQVEALSALFDDVRLEVQANPDCLAFQLFARADRPDVIVAYEGWRNETVRQAHLKDVSVQRFVAASSTVLSGPLRKMELRSL